MAKYHFEIFVFFIFVIVLINTVSVHSLSEYLLDNDTLALYHLDEGNGLLVKDETGNYNGILTGNNTLPVWINNVAPLIGSTSALKFSGGNDGYVTVSNNNLLKNPIAFTIETWFNVTGMPTGGSACGSSNCFMLISKDSDDNSNSLFQLFYESTNTIGINFYVGNPLPVRFAYNIPNPILNEWHHVAATHNGSTVNLYFDGVLVAAGNTPALNNATTPVLLGRDGRQNFTRVFDGVLDEIRISNIARNPCEFNVFVSGCPLPILLIHGIYGDDSIWGQVKSILQNNGYNSFSVGEIFGLKGLVPNNGDITFLADQVRLAVQNIKSQTGSSNVNVIAHSMGGLATRWYINSPQYQNDINELITLGTPNQGASIAINPITFLFGLVAGDDPFDIARYQMIPGSSFLQTLNSNYNTSGVQHIEIAGNTTNPLSWLLAPWYVFSKTDSIVPIFSVNIPNIKCYEDSAVHTSILGNAYYDDNVTISTILKLLKGGKGIKLPQCPGGQIKSSLPGMSNNVQVISANDAVNSKQTKIVFSNISLGNKFSAMLNWSSPGKLDIEFVTPSGNIVNATNYNNFSNVSMFNGTFLNTNIQSFTFNNPQQGNWTIMVVGSNIVSQKLFEVNVFMEKNITLQVLTDKNSYKPNQTFFITSTLTNGLLPVLNANVLVNITKPDNFVSAIQLFDDGLHNDSSANDGIYGNSFLDTSLEGSYVLDVNASVTGQFSIGVKNAVFVELLPDLSINDNDINFTPSKLIPGEGNIINISANIFNIGEKDANNAVIEFYDGNPYSGGKLFSNVTVNVLANNSAFASTLFLVKAPLTSNNNLTSNGTGNMKPYNAELYQNGYNIYIVASAFSGFIESNYSNNKANKIINFIHNIYQRF